MHSVCRRSAGQTAWLGNWARNTWIRLTSLLSLTPRQSSHASGVHNVVGATRAHPSEQKMLRVAAELLKRHDQVGMVVVALRDLPELDDVFGHAAARRVLAIAVDKLGSVSGKAALLRTAPTLLTLLVPGWSSKRVSDAVLAALGNPCRIELEVDGQGVVVLPGLAADTVDRETASIERVYDDLRRAVLPRHPPRHHRKVHLNHSAAPEPRTKPNATRPLLPPAQVDSCPPEVYCPPLPPTIPVRLGVR